MFNMLFSLFFIFVGLTSAQIFGNTNAGQIGLPIDTMGTVPGYADAAGGVPLLSPLELNAIMEAQSMPAFKNSFGSDSGSSGRQFSSDFLSSFDESQPSGFGSGSSDFYESTAHGDSGSSHSGSEPEPKDLDQDNRGSYHRTEGDYDKGLGLVGSNKPSGYRDDEDEHSLQHRRPHAHSYNEEDSHREGADSTSFGSAESYNNHDDTISRLHGSDSGSYNSEAGYRNDGAEEYRAHSDFEDNSRSERYQEYNDQSAQKGENEDGYKKQRDSTYRQFDGRARPQAGERPEEPQTYRDDKAFSSSNPGQYKPSGSGSDPMSNPLHAPNPSVPGITYSPQMSEGEFYSRFGQSNGFSSGFRPQSFGSPLLTSMVRPQYNGVFNSPLNNEYPDYKVITG